MGRYSYGVMSRETAHKVIERAYEEGPSYCVFGFQGGEPALAGLSFFRDFAAYARERRPEGTELAFTMQTNGLELEDDFLDFLKKEQFLVGVSLDGPKRIHDRNRTLGNQEGTFLQVMDTIKRMQEKCQGCEARIICRGGCIREYENGNYHYCQAYQEFYRFAKERLYWLTSH